MNTPIAIKIAGLLSALTWSSAVCAAAMPHDLAIAAAQYDRAQVDGSRPLFEKMLARDYQLVNGAGQVETRGEFIAESTAPGFKIDPFVVEEAVVSVWANGAVLGGRVHLTGSDGGKRFDAYMRFADVWARRAGRWQVIFTQVTRVPTPK